MHALKEAARQLLFDASQMSLTRHWHAALLRLCKGSIKA